MKNSVSVPISVLSASLLVRLLSIELHYLKQGGGNARCVSTASFSPFIHASESERLPSFAGDWSAAPITSSCRTFGSNRPWRVAWRSGDHGFPVGERPPQHAPGR